METARSDSGLERLPTEAWDPAGAQIAWGSLGVLAIWFVVAGALAVRFFRWEGRAG